MPLEAFKNGSRGFVRRSASLSALKPGQRLGWLREKAGRYKTGLNAGVLVTSGVGLRL